MRDIRPSSVVCSGTLSNLTWRKTCRYKNLYFVNSEWTYAANERDSALNFSEWQRSHKVMAQDRPIHNLQSVPSEYLFVPRRVPISEVQEQLRTADNPLRSVSGYSILFNTFYPQAPGHLVWNDLFALFTALSDMGMAHGVAVRPILLSLKSYERGYCINELIERFLGSGPTLFAKDFVNHKQNVLVEHAVVGTGQGGADDVQQLRRLLQGRPGTRHAFRSFRDRLMLQFGLDPGRERRRSTDFRIAALPLKVVVVDNKRKDLNIKKIVSQLNATGRANQSWQVTHLNFSVRGHDGGYGGLSGFGNLLDLLRDTDIYVSGIGTAMMWAPFIASGGVVVNLGNIGSYSPKRRYVSHRHSLDHAMQDQQRVLYYPAELRWAGVSPSQVETMVQRAAQLIRSGFASSSNNPKFKCSWCTVC